MSFKENLTTTRLAALDIGSWLLDLLFPIRCLICGQEDKQFICLFCKSQLEPVNGQICAMCRKSSMGGITHAGCQTAWGPNGLISLLNYQDTNVARLIIQGKYSFLPGVFEAFGKLLAHTIYEKHDHLLKEQYLLCPLPLHTRRQRWRGFNQAEILCKFASQEWQKNYSLQVPIINALIRKKPTKTQKDLKRDERLKNMDSAFGLSAKSLNLEFSILNQNLILVDDVTTTGATLLEATKVLKRNGAKNVWCVTIARD